ncbi:hypothetical protein [Bdellovibrio bacteriovorus]
MATACTGLMPRTVLLTYGLGRNNLGLRYEMVRGANEIGYWRG